MAEINPPLWIDGEEHPGPILRAGVAALLKNPLGGVKGNGLAVTALGSPAMAVSVAAGTALVAGTETPVEQFVYVCPNDGAVELAISPADVTNPRRDLIVARVRDSNFSGATDAWALEVVTGTPAGSPVDPTVPANSLVLARVAVAANEDAIESGHITDLRTTSGEGRATALGGVTTCTSTTRPSSPLDGDMIFETDTLRVLQYRTSTGWNPPWNLPWGTLGYAAVTANQTGLAAGPTDLTSLSVTVDPPAGRRLRVSGGFDLTGVAENDQFYGHVRTGSTILGRVGRFRGGIASNDAIRFDGSVILTPSAGSVTYKLSVQRVTGSGTADMAAASDNPAFILVEDIGPA